MTKIAKCSEDEQDLDLDVVAVFVGWGFCGLAEDGRIFDTNAILKPSPAILKMIMARPCWCWRRIGHTSAAAAAAAAAAADYE